MQYDGSRFYDPLVGGYVQPNPLLRPAALPQALHPYSATPLGPPGAGGSGQGGISPLLAATGSNAISAGSGLALGAYSNNLIGRLSLQANNSILERAGYSSLFERIGGRGRNIQYHSSQVAKMGGQQYRTVGNQIIDLAELEAQAKSGWSVRYSKGGAFAALNDNAAKRFLRTKGGQFAAGFAINLALVTPELAAPWQNPYLSTDQRVAQNLVTGSGALASTGAGVWVGNWAATAAIGGPATFVLVTGAGVGMYVVWEGVVKPGVSWVSTALGKPDPYREYIMFQPLGGGQ